MLTQEAWTAPETTQRLCEVQEKKKTKQTKQKKNVMLNPYIPRKR